MNLLLNDVSAQAVSPAADYARYCRPKLADLLASLRLDVNYEKAAGTTLFMREDATDELTPVLDFVSGFGAGLFGHNHPVLKQTLTEQLDQDAPMLAQSAIRGGAARLAAQLNRLLGTQGRYLCNFTNSGAESIEAVLKHAYKVRFDAVRRTYDRVTRDLDDLCARIESEGLEVELPENKELSKFRDDLDERNVAQFDQFRRAPAAIALKGSFHGKTSAALKMTFNKSYREGYEGLAALEPIFVDPLDVARLPQIVAEHRIEFLVPRLEGNRVVLEPLTMTRAIAVIFEVILGEGGNRELPEATLRTLAELHPALGVPYAIDEIQTGCGRTGAMFAYTQTPLAAIEPEYLALSKALGGGLVKIGAALIHERVYDPDFGILHTSTFAEDDVSCAVASRVLDLLASDKGALLAQIREKGAYLKRRLNELMRKYPEVVAEVRGRGLMLGLEFRELQDRSPLFRYAGKQGFLSLLIASYLLHHHRIRALAPITTLVKGNPGKKRPSVLRIQPAALISRTEMDRFVDALDEVLNVVDKNDEYLLIAHLIGERVTPEQRRRSERLPVGYPLSPRREDFDARVGFVMHPTTLAYLTAYYFPTFARYHYNQERMACWWTNLARFLEPDVVHVEYVEHDGFVVEANFVAIPYLPEYMVKNFVAAKAGRADARQHVQEIQDKIQDAATVARELGDEAVPTAMVGLGAFTSIVTHNGTTLNDYEIPVTTGNAYTAALMLQAIERAASDAGLVPGSAVTGVLGAAGNIGSVLAALLCEQSRHVMLFGRDRCEGLARLAKVRHGCMRHVLELAAEAVAEGKSLDEAKFPGLVGDIVKDVLVPVMEGERPTALISVLRGDEPATLEHGALLDRLVAARHGFDENPYFSLHVDLERVQDCDVVAIATNSTNAHLVTPKSVKKGAIVCSASVPSNLSRSFASHLDEYRVFDGGFAQLPENNAIDWVGMPPDGQAYGCLAETLLMGFDGRNRSFAKGAVCVAQVRATLKLAEQYGFSLGELKLAQQRHPSSTNGHLTTHSRGTAS